MTKTLIDTSAWIEFFRNSNSPYGDIVSILIEQDRATITGPIMAELLQGAKSHRERDTLRDLLKVISYIDVKRSDWDETGTLLGKLRRKGITLPLTDALIASIAKRNNHNVLTLDNHFKHLGIPLYPVKIES